VHGNCRDSTTEDPEFQVSFGCRWPDLRSDYWTMFVHRNQRDVETSVYCTIYWTLHAKTGAYYRLRIGTFQSCRPYSLLHYIRMARHHWAQPSVVSRTVDARETIADMRKQIDFFHWPPRHLRWYLSSLMDIFGQYKADMQISHTSLHHGCAR
jgi:hypothetical protein